MKLEIIKFFIPELNLHGALIGTINTKTDFTNSRIINHTDWSFSLSGHVIIDFMSLPASVQILLNRILSIHVSVPRYWIQNCSTSTSIFFCPNSSYLSLELRVGNQIFFHFLLFHFSFSTTRTIPWCCFLSFPSLSLVLFPVGKNFHGDPRTIKNLPSVSRQSLLVMKEASFVSPFSCENFFFEQVY